MKTKDFYILLDALNTEQQSSVYSYYAESGIYTLKIDNRQFATGLTVREACVVIEALRGLNTLILLTSIINN